MPAVNANVGPVPATAIVFARYPRLGCVKTRLAAEIGDTAALAVYKSCLADVLASLDRSGLPNLVYCEPAIDIEPMRALLGPHRALAGQHGASLGERLQHAFAQTFAAGAGAALAIGGDCPQLDAKTLAGASSLLAHYPAVIGPARDGGYYLIGFRSDAYRPEFFSDIPFGGQDVLAATLSRLAEAATKPAMLPVLRDLDRLADVLALAETPGIAATRTRATLRELGLGDIGV